MRKKRTTQPRLVVACQCGHVIPIGPAPPIFGPGAWTIRPRFVRCTRAKCEKGRVYQPEEMWETTKDFP
jgi:hypothetical protein